jgi:hypothetical protein
MSDVFGKIQAQGLRELKVSEPSLAYAAKSTAREVIFALDIPYPLCKNSYKISPLHRKLKRLPEVRKTNTNVNQSILM